MKQAIAIVERLLKEYREEEPSCEEHQNDIDLSIMELQSLLRDFKEHDMKVVDINTLQRYDIQAGMGVYVGSFDADKCDDGDWVYFDDVEKLLVDHTSLPAECVNSIPTTLWDIEDIKSATQHELTNSEAIQVWKSIEYNHDPMYGINWDTICEAIEDFIEYNPRSIDSEG